MKGRSRLGSLVSVKGRGALKKVVLLRLVSMERRSAGLEPVDCR